MGTNDHMAFVKVEGPWKDTNSISSAVKKQNIESMPLKKRLKNMAAQLGLYFQWQKVGKVDNIVSRMLNPEQFKYLSQMHYDNETEISTLKIFCFDLLKCNYVLGIIFLAVESKTFVPII